MTALKKCEGANAGDGERGEEEEEREYKQSKRER